MKSKYSAEERFQIVMESFASNVTQAEICRRHGIYPVQLIKWKEQFILGGKGAYQLAQRRNSDSRDDEIQNLKKVIGDQSLVIDAFKKRLQGR
jgi:transposase-like protein